MKILTCIFLFGAGLATGVAQTPVVPVAAPATDAKALLQAAGPLYNFNAPDMKPWHLKASYQLFDYKGKPDGEGTFEYWWASPKTHRATWTRGNVTQSEWSTEDGAQYTQASGKPLRYFERILMQELFPEFPEMRDVLSGEVKASSNLVDFGNTKLDCLSTLVPIMMPGVTPEIPRNKKFCFTTSSHVLLISHSDQVSTVYSHVVKTQNRYIAKQMESLYDKNKMFHLSVDSIELIESTNAALRPPAELKPLPADNLVKYAYSRISGGELIRRTTPAYPSGARALGDSGVVILAARIGTDGKLHDPEVFMSPSGLLTEAALEAVRHWEYRPYTLNGVPVEVDTTISVIFVPNR